jgi:truncated hemoglobin YjbI
MDMNDQMTAYMWLFREVFGTLPAGVIYDGVAKKLPAKPKRLVAGGMSTQWIDTTAAVYRRALTDAGLNEGAYAEFLARLEDRDGQEQNPFFTRWRVHIPHGAVDSFAQYLPFEYRDMVAAGAVGNEGLLYPNVRWEGCWDCGVQDLCKAIQFREDFDFLVESFYSRSEGHSTIRSAKIHRGDLESFMDLRGREPSIFKVTKR